MSKSRLTLTMIAVLSVLPIAAGIVAWQIPLKAAPQEVRDADGVQVKTDFGPFKLLHRDAVAYPDEARKKGVSGDVVAGLSVNSQGEVTDARIVSGPEELRRAVLQSVLGWHFADETHNLPANFEVAVRFNAAAAAPVMQQDLGLSNLALGLAFSAFNYSYAPFQLVGGWFADRFGARRTLTVCGLVWSLTTIATGAVTGLASLFGVRLVLGMGEGATLPAATRAVSKWIPVDKRGTAIGATHAAGRLGAGTAAPIVAFLIGWFSFTRD